jgi:transcriptional regulator with XRE-family HTH domain
MAVRQLREHAGPAGFSQETFALKAGIARSYYGKIERGEVNISLDLIERISRTLGITVGRLFAETDKFS